MKRFKNSISKFQLFFSGSLGFVLLVLVYASCSSEIATIESPDIETRSTSNETVPDIFDIGSCGQVYDLNAPGWVCTNFIVETDTFTGIEPFVDCVFVGNYSYRKCRHDLFTGGIENIYINEPKVWSSCPELLLWMRNHKGTEAAAMKNRINQQIIAQIEDLVWENNNFEYLSCFNQSHNTISWVKASCFAWKLLYDLGSTSPKWYKIACEGAGCCFRNTFFCKDKDGNIKKYTSNVEMKEPKVTCEESTVVNDNGYGGQDTSPCELNCGDIK